MWATGQTRELLSPAQLLQGAEEHLSVEEKARRERMRQSMRGFTSFELSKDGSFLLIPLSGKLYTYQLRTADSSEITPSPIQASAAVNRSSIRICRQAAKPSPTSAGVTCT